jgi:serine/threonine-protein kinase HipA
MRGLIVYLNNRRVGVLGQEDSPIFTYDQSWLHSAEAYPLSRQLPLQAEPLVGRVVRAFFSGLLPEAEARERIASILGVSAGNDFALLERIGGECAGAVSLWPEGQSPPASTGPSSRRRLDESELEEIVRQLPQRPLLAGAEGVRLSLAGAQVKLPVIVDPIDGTLALPLGAAASTHILKPEPSRFPGLAANEAFCMALARTVGLDAVETQWRMVGTTPCLLVRRYDRELTADGSLIRIHQEDFCQALGVPPERKYQNEGGPSLLDCIDLLRRWSSAPVVDIRNFLDGLIFAVLTGNADAHAKNFSWIYRGANRRMASLYDQVCTLAWPELSTALSMKVGAAKLLPEVSPEHFQQLSAKAGLGWPMVRARLADLASAVDYAARNDAFALPTGATPFSEAARQIVASRATRMLQLLA